MRTCSAAWLPALVLALTLASLSAPARALNDKAFAFSVRLVRDSL